MIFINIKIKKNGYTMVYDKDLEDRVRNLLPKNELVSEKKMFGSLAFMYQNNMVCAVMEDGLMARVGPVYYNKALERDYVTEMNLTGRTMKNIVLVSIDGLEEEEELQFWLTKSLEFAKSLPPKEKKPKTEKKKISKKPKKARIL